MRLRVKTRKGQGVNTVRYVGHGAEIEDDTIRLRRRKLEFDDAARRSRQREPRPRKARGVPAALARWRSPRPGQC